MVVDNHGNIITFHTGWSLSPLVEVDKADLFSCKVPDQNGSGEMTPF
jgi:hypothetical protein